MVSLADQADGLFNGKSGPWLASPSNLSLPPCTFSGPMSDTYLADCPGDDGETASTGCGSYHTLADAEQACQAVATCGGVTQQYGEFTIRAGNKPMVSPPGKPSTSWPISNLAECRGPPPSDQDAAAHSAAAFAGLTRTDPAAVWVYVILEPFLNL